MSTASEQAEQPRDCCPACRTAVVVKPAPDFWHPVPCPRCGNPLWFLRKAAGDVVVLRFLGSPSPTYWNDTRVAIGDLTYVVANLGDLSWITSPMLNVLLFVKRQLEASGGQLRLCGPRPSVTEIIRMMRLDDWFAIDADEGQSLDRLKRTPLGP
jgi:hypothetical protein